MTEVPPSSPPRPAVPAFLFMAAWVFFFWRYGYAYAIGDQDELLPLLFHRADPDLLAADWFVQTQTETLSVRSYFVWLLRLCCLALPTWLAVALLYTGLWFWIAHGVYRLALTIVPDRTAAALAVVAHLAVAHKWTLGGNDMAYTMLVPEMLAWALALPAVRAFMRGRLVPAALLLGVAAWFQLLVGLLTAGVLGLLLLWRVAESPPADRRPGDLLRFAGAFFVASLPVSAPIFLQQLDARALPAEPSVFYILAPFRNPFHHMAFSFEPREWLKFGLAVSGGGWGYALLRRRLDPSVRRFLFRFLGITAALCVVTLVFTEFVPVLLIAKFQAYKLTVWLKLGFVVLLCGGVVRLLPASWRGAAEAGLDRPAAGWSVATALAAATLALAVQGFEPAEARMQPLAHRDAPLGRVERWARTHTAPEAVFAVPPSNSSFRSVARRPIVVSWTAFPFNDGDMQAWYRRLLDLAPIDPPRRGLGLKPVLDTAYHGLDDTAWLDLAARYGIAYVLVDHTLLDPPLPFAPVHSDGPWTIYRIDPEEP